MPEALLQPNGILRSNHIEGVGKIRPNKKDLASFSTEMKEPWKKKFVGLEDKPLALVLLASIYFGDHADAPGQYFSLGTALAHPHSRGSVHVSSKELKDPAFDGGFFRESVDVEVLQREIARRMERYRGPLESCHHVFEEGSEASFEVADRDVRRVPVSEITDVRYTKEDNKAIVECLRKRVETMWHSLGTCAMKPFDSGGVVDGDLNVYGVTGLKVVGVSCFGMLV
ncbi:hypothetical protein ACEPPN_018571 [Leptodophora sp. 'Broadleaf-Isolate-01']